MNLGVTFTIDAMWPDREGVFDPFVAVVAIAAFIAMQRFKAGLMPVIGACARDRARMVDDPRVKRLPGSSSMPAAEEGSRG